MVNLSEKERIDILMIIDFGDWTRTHVEVCVFFNNTHPIATFAKTVKSFVAIWSVKGRQKIGRPKAATNEKNVLIFCQILLKTQKISLHQHPHWINKVNN